MWRLLDGLFGIEKESRTSTKYAMRAGWLLIVAIIAVTFMGLNLGFIGAGNIVEVIWAYFITAGSLFGINVTRVTIENVKAKGKGDEKK